MNRFFTAIALLQFTSLVAQPLGPTFVAGTTWYDYQHNGSVSRMIAEDIEGNLQVAWTDLQNDDSRVIFGNLWVSAQGNFQSNDGYWIAGTFFQRAGYVTMAVHPESGCPVIAYHKITQSDPHAMANLCESVEVEPPQIDNHPIIWPHLAVDFNGTIHLLSKVNASPVDTTVFYSRGIPVFDDFGQPDTILWDDFNGSGYLPIGHSSVIAHTVAAARHSPRVARAWLSSHHPNPVLREVSNDVLLQLSEDGGQTWGDIMNITNFRFRDSLCCDTAGNPLFCQRDTLAAHWDVNLLFDQNDQLHVAFTTRTFFAACDTSGTSWIARSLCWHWSEVTHQFSLLADGNYFLTYDSSYVDPGIHQTTVQRPSLAIDEAAGRLYCAYMRYDGEQVSQDLFPSADLWLTVSTDGGSHWSTGINVTRTRPSVIPTPPGQGLHERDPSLSERVTNGVAHLFYCLDRDAGSIPHNEGSSTYNDMLYQRIPVDSIPTTPLIENYPLHWDSTGFYTAAENPRAPLPTEITLRAYPNPFNSTTNIEFTLTRSEKITLKIHDILGREVTTLANKTLPAGTHNLSWNADNISSGLYFVSLLTSTQTHTQKLLLLR